MTLLVPRVENRRLKFDFGGRFSAESDGEDCAEIALRLKEAERPAEGCVVLGVSEALELLEILPQLIEHMGDGVGHTAVAI